MITKKLIQEIEGFNLPLLHEAIRQAELKVVDENKRKERIDRRLFSLLSTLLAIIATITAFVQINLIDNLCSTVCIILSIVCFSIAITYSILALLSQSYAGLGVYPDTWLQKSIISKNRLSKDDDNMFGYVLSNILYDYQEATLVSHDSNCIRTNYLTKAFLVTVIGIIPLIMIIFEQVIGIFNLGQF